LEPLQCFVEDIETYSWISLDFAKYRKTSEIEQMAAINIYTREWGQPPSLYTVLNNRLRSESREELKPFFPYLQLLISSLIKLAPPYEGPVWRGVSQDLSEQYKRGSKIFWWGFSSCTMDMNILENNMFLGITGDRTLFNIHCKKGFDVKQYSSAPTESEILLLPGTYFEVSSVLNVGNGLHIIELKELDPPFEIIKGLKQAHMSTLLPAKPKIPTTPKTPKPSQKHTIKCINCGKDIRLEQNTKGDCVHTKPWHSRFEDCNYLKCGWGLGINGIGAQHWGCCFKRDFDDKVCPKSKNHSLAIV